MYIKLNNVILNTDGIKSVSVSEEKLKIRIVWHLPVHSVEDISYLSKEAMLYDFNIATKAMCPNS